MIRITSYLRGEQFFHHIEHFSYRIDLNLQTIVTISAKTEVHFLVLSAFNSLILLDRLMPNVSAIVSVM